MDHPPEPEKPGRSQSRRTFLAGLAKVAEAGGITSGWSAQGIEQNERLIAPESAGAFSSLSSELTAEWLSPRRTYRPHTRWWWPGNAVTRDGIAWELEQMRQQGMGGVEIMSPWRMYVEGNIPYLSQQFVDMVKYAVQEAERQDMEVAITFDPGWKFGGLGSAHATQ